MKFTDFKCTYRRAKDSISVQKDMCINCGNLDERPECCPLVEVNIKKIDEQK